MDNTSSPTAARDFVEQVLRTGLTLADLIADLLETIPENAYPGEEPAEVLVDMIAGSFQPAADAAGPDDLERATALLGALADRTLADIEAAAELARSA